MQYSQQPRKRKHKPRVYQDHVGYRPCLRLEFDHQCLYCLSSEAEVGPGLAFGGFHVEHFRPEKRFRKLAKRYDNLAWACETCNLTKGDTWPTDDEVAAGSSFPEMDDSPFGHHLQIMGDRVDAITTQGQYLIDEVGLNSRTHVMRREKRAVVLARLETLAQLKQASNLSPMQRAICQEMQEILELLVGSPWDGGPCKCAL